MSKRNIIRMVPTFTFNHRVQYTLTVPNYTFKRNVSDILPIMKVISSVGDTLIHDALIIKHKNFWSDETGFIGRISYHLESEHEDNNVFIITDDLFNKIEYMKIIKKKYAESQEIQFVLTQSKTKYSSSMLIVE
jgi:hypothetical protein